MIGTVAAVFVALLVWLHGARLQRRMSDSDQAALVAPWLQEGEIWYSNGSPLPVYQATVLIEDPGAPDDVEGQQEWFALTLPPTGGRPQRWPDHSMDKISYSAHLMEFNFRDAAGREWIRVREGRLNRLDADRTSTTLLGRMIVRARMRIRRWRIRRVSRA